MALNLFVSLISRLVARSGRKLGNRQADGRTDGMNDKTTTVTLAAHARRGLNIMFPRSDIKPIRSFFLRNVTAFQHCIKLRNTHVHDNFLMYFYVFYY